MDKTSTANNGTDNVNKDKTGSRQALWKLLGKGQGTFYAAWAEKEDSLFLL